MDVFLAFSINNFICSSFNVFLISIFLIQITDDSYSAYKNVVYNYIIPKLGTIKMVTLNMCRNFRSIFINQYNPIPVFFFNFSNGINFEINIFLIPKLGTIKMVTLNRSHIQKLFNEVFSFSQDVANCI